MRLAAFILTLVLGLALTTAIEAQTITPEQFGAVGDGVHDDTDAFQAAARHITSQGGGTLVLAKAKTYRVGRQQHIQGKKPYWIAEPIFVIHPTSNAPAKPLHVTIEGNGATLKLNDGLRLGAFDENTGQPITASRPSLNRQQRVEPGHILSFTQCESVTVRNLVIDGNSSSLILGGPWGDTGWQVSANGLSLSSCKRIRIEHVTSSHCGLDGISLNDWQHVSDPDWQITDSRFEYNARQGLSWTGGSNLTVTRSKFNHTGRGKFKSAPSAGLDIEAESTPIRNGRFIDCEFVNNAGCGLVADSGNSADVSFTRCLFWGTTSWSAWVRKPGFRFHQSTFHGQATNIHGSTNPRHATQFHHCRFEDVHDAPYEGQTLSSYASPGNECLINNMGENVLLEHCTLIANRVGSGAFGSQGTVILRHCEFVHRSSAPRYRGIQCALYDVDISHTRFREALDPQGPSFQIAILGVVSVGPGVVVDGPRCTWSQGPSAQTGVIPSRPTVTITPSISLPGQGSLNVHVRYPSNNPQQRLELVQLHQGTPPSPTQQPPASNPVIVSSQDLHDTSPSPDPASPHKQLTFAMPASPGRYHVRLIDSAQPGQSSTPAAVSKPLLVTAVSITAESQAVAPGEKIVVHIKNVPPADGAWSTHKNWVGLYRKDAPDHDFGRGRVAWQYFSGTKTPPSSLPSTATLTFTAPAAPGEYDLRLFLQKHQGRALIKSHVITVKAPVTP